MDQETYAVVFSGGIVDGFTVISVQTHLARILKLDATRMASLFAGKAVVLKRTADKAEALRYGGALKKVGADISIKIIKAPVAKAAEAGFSLAANTGNLFEPTTPPPPMQVDIRGLSLLPNNGTPLVAASPPAPRVAAPNFTLDAPGARLDTIKAERPLIRPNISGLSLAFPGGDLLTPEERQKAPPPSPPDVSNIHLASQFD